MGSAIEKLGVLVMLLMFAFVAAAIIWVLFYQYYTTTPAIFGG